MTTMTGLGELTGDYVIDTTRTRIGFVARHTMATRVRGHFDAFEGGAYLDGDDPSKSSVRLTIQANSIRTRKRQRDDYLRGKFLDTDRHPAITFASTEVRQAGEAAYQVTGNLTMRGVTRPVTVDFELTRAEKDRHGTVRAGFRGRVTIDRNDWGVNWNAATTVLVSPEVMLELDVTAVRRS
ncbi:polyisoprenoid-binding protein [Nonomuraea phyllanthi]|uniref:YceI family protein n=1 Tax=Nonomuraea phyllanthi TaxID=2219224 RepID=UPI0012940BC5|nr:YceI family protein [Nonomuraea phyllanthi]QFY09433.1 polyisoprenoid-binding protein [Nonomuraea phyllanthi]